MSEDLFNILFTFCIVLLLILCVVGPILFPVLEYKKTKCLIRSILHFFIHPCMLIVLAVEGLLLMSFFNKLMQGLFEQHILCLPLRTLSTIITWFILILPAIVFRKRISRCMFMYYLCTAIILCITIAFGLFPYKAYFWF